MDDQGVGVPDLQVYIIWKRAPEIGRVTSGHDGSFSLEYYVEYEDKVGSIPVTARIKDTMVHLATEATVTYTVKVPTINTIVGRLDENYNITRGDRVNIAGRLHEDWGGHRGVEVQRELINLYIDDVLVDTKRTAFDGSVRFTFVFDGTYEIGVHTVMLEFPGTEFFEASYTESFLVLQVQGALSFTDLEVNDRPFDPERDIVLRRDTLSGRVLVRDGSGEPLAGLSVSVHCKDEGPRARMRLIGAGQTDLQGRFGFNWTFTTHVMGDKFLVAEAEGVSSEAAVLELAYLVPPEPSSSSGIILSTGDHWLEVGTTLELRVEPRDPRDWDVANLTVRLVYHPEGMEVSPDGTITWTPNEGQAGRHTVTVLLYDGRNTGTDTVEISVLEAAPERDGPCTGLLALLAVCALCVAVVIVAMVRSGRAR